MPRRHRKPRQPSYRLHRPSGQAVVTIDGKDHYLGPHGTPESHREYAELIARWHTAHPIAPVVQQNRPSNSLSVNELLELCWGQHFQEYYSQEGKPTTESANMSLVIRTVSALFGLIRACDFGPKRLKELRQHMITVQKLARTEVNKRIGRVKRIFKYAVSEELVPPSVFHGLQTVSGLRYGRGDARETEPVTTVPDLWICAVLPFVSPQIAAMIVVQRLTGMRPGELVIMRPCDIDNSGQVWEYRPYTHKCRWRNHKRVVLLGAEVQSRLKPFLARAPDAFLFSPTDAEANRNTERRRKRKTPMTPSQQKREPKQRPKRGKRDRYDRDSYRRAVEYGIAKAKKHGIHIPHWHPNQLRHNHATDVRRVFGVEAAQVALGQARTDVIEVYAEKNTELAAKVAQRMG